MSTITLDVKKLERTLIEWHLDDEVDRQEARKYARRLISRLKDAAMIVAPPRPMLNEYLHDRQYALAWVKNVSTSVTVGRCILCGRNVTRSMVNKYGVRCRYEGAQYDFTGKFLYAGERGKPYSASAAATKARSTIL